MTWQCPRCMVTFRTTGRPHKNLGVNTCEVPNCSEKYMEGFKQGGAWKMYLVSPAMEEYRRKHEEDKRDER